MPIRIVLPVFAAALAIVVLTQTETSPRCTDSNCALILQPQHGAATNLSSAFRDYYRAIAAKDAGATYARGQFMSALATLKHQP